MATLALWSSTTCRPTRTRSSTRGSPRRSTRGARPRADGARHRDLDGAPSVRMVLLKGHDDAGSSSTRTVRAARARSFGENPRAAGVLHWKPLERQVRVEGAVEELADEESAAYFGTRPRDSQIGAWASPQSQPVADRSELERRAAEIEVRFASEASVPLPPFWGGYRIVATTIEFWQGRPGPAPRPGAVRARIRRLDAASGWRRSRELAQPPYGAGGRESGLRVHAGRVPEQVALCPLESRSVRSGPAPPRCCSPSPGPTARAGPASP